MFDINEVPYAEWLEKSLQAIVPLKPVSLCFAATMPDGEVYTGYYNADATDKAVIAHSARRTASAPNAHPARGGQRGAVNGDLVGEGDRAVVPDGGRSEKADQGAR